MIDTRFETTIDLRGEIENYRQVALIKYYKILLELDPRRDRLTMLAVIRCIDKLERHSQERKRPRNDKKKMLAEGTLAWHYQKRNQLFRKAGLYDIESPSTSSTTKKSSTHTRNGKSANVSKPAVGKLSEGKPKRTRTKKKNPCNRPPLTKPIRTCKKTARQPGLESRHTPRSPYRPYPGVSGAALPPVIPLENLHPDSTAPLSIATEENKSDRWRVNLIPSFFLSISMSRNGKSPFSPTMPHSMESHFLVSSVFC